MLKQSPSLYTRMHQTKVSSLFLGSAPATRRNIHDSPKCRITGKTNGSAVSLRVHFDFVMHRRQKQYSQISKLLFTIFH